MSPERIQRKRTKGWRTPRCSCGCGKPAIYVGRPTKWGNPYAPDRYSIGFLTGLGGLPVWRAATVAECVATYRHDVACRDPEHIAPTIYADHPWTADLDLSELRGHDLMCWCPLEDGNGNRVPCHADVLLELANA